MREREPAATCARIAELAELPAVLPEGMIPEVLFVRLVRALRDTLPPERSEAVLRLSGAFTAAYVAKNRIPAPVRALLAVLPERLAVPLLLAAFRRNAWTFAGAGRFDVDAGRYPGVILLDGCPTCREDAARELPAGVLAGAYYEGAFEGLLRLAARRVRVREVACRARAGAPCRFQITLDDVDEDGEPSCASS